MALLKQQEAICTELGDRARLGRCYWATGLIAGMKGQSATADDKFKAALEIFTELGMTRERDAVQKLLEE